MFMSIGVEFLFLILRDMVFSLYSICPGMLMNFLKMVLDLQFSNLLKSLAKR